MLIEDQTKVILNVAFGKHQSDHNFIKIYSTESDNNNALHTYIHQFYFRHVVHINKH